MKHVLLAGLMAVALFGCGQGSDDEEEVGQAAGDVMASADEALQGGGIAMNLPMLHREDISRKGLMQQALDLAIPSAEAAGRCAGSATFTSCQNGERTRTFTDCTVGPSTLSGSVTLTFSDTAACSMASANDSVTRAADFTLTGPRGGTLHVSAPGGGQKLTRTTDGFTYSVLGMQRVLTGPGGRTQFDVSTKTLSDISITGQDRAHRVVNGGELEVSHNLRNYKVVLTPNNLTWTGTCNCPTSGTLTGTASGSITGNFTVEMTGCGTATVTANGQTKNVTLDRCGSL